MNLAAAALHDQADAAASQAIAGMSVMAKDPRGSLRVGAAGPVSTRILRKLGTLTITNRVALCPHLSLTAPKPAFWSPWAPGTIRCAECQTRAAQRLEGTPEDNRCDHCRRISIAELMTIAVQLPAVVVNRPPKQPFSIPPIQVQFGLCKPCWKKDQPARQGEEGTL